MHYVLRKNLYKDSREILNSCMYLMYLEHTDVYEETIKHQG